MAPTSGAGSRTSALIKAPREAIYQAFLDPEALPAWLAPGDMTGQVHQFDGRVGGGYRMSLFYPASEPERRGKTAGQEDRYTARFIELVPPERIIEAISFESDDAQFDGQMTMIVTLEERGDATEVTIAFENIPPGIRPEDNDAGTRSSLEKLARYVEGSA